MSNAAKVILQKLNKALRIRGFVISTLTRTTDFARWSDRKNFSASWDARGRLAVELCRGLGPRVCDLGCGQQAVKPMLPEGSRYMPMDLHKWTSETIVCDINKRFLPTQYLEDCDICILLGVFEYLAEPDFLVEKLATYVPVIVGSCHHRRMPAAFRLQRGWLNALSWAELRAKLETAGFVIDREESIDAQIVFRAHNGALSSRCTLARDSASSFT